MLSFTVQESDSSSSDDDMEKSVSKKEADKQRRAEVPLIYFMLEYICIYNYVLTCVYLQKKELRKAKKEIIAKTKENQKLSGTANLINPQDIRMRSPLPHCLPNIYIYIILLMCVCGW